MVKVVNRLSTRVVRLEVGKTLEVFGGDERKKHQANPRFLKLPNGEELTRL